MKTEQSIFAIREQVAQWRISGESVAFVPTMGHLHAGHLALVQQAKQFARRVVVSIFVNPLQFGQGEDLSSYPRTLEADVHQLESHGVDLLFAPTEDEVYPLERDNVTTIDVPGLTSILEGAHRPGHFQGVATVVAKLFNIVQPDVAVFGEKDFQQLAVIRRMVQDLDIPVEVYGAPTIRETDGLAMSSRNGYLAPQERAVAPSLYQVLQFVSEGLRQGQGVVELESTAKSKLTQAGFEPDYVSIRRVMDLAEPQGGESALIVLAAAHLGTTRLIDNLLINMV